MPSFTVERMTPEQWARVRAVRLRALADSPDAFGRTFAEEEAAPLSRWSERLESAAAATFIAVTNGEDVGLVGGAPYAGATGAAGLFGMWVAPQCRGRGIGSALVDALVAWARGAGVDRVLLDVADANLAAVRFYESKGFVPTGVLGSLPAPREHVKEHQRVLVLVPS